MLHAAIFDLDGTLLDTIADITAILNYGLAEYNLPLHSIKECKKMVGEGIEVLVQKALPSGFKDEPLYNEILSVVRIKYNENTTGDTVPYPGIPALLDQLTELNIPIAILSNKPHYVATESAEQLLGKWNFSVVQGALEHKAPKPGKTAALQIAAKMKIDPSAIAFIGDSEIDIQTAKNTGMYSIAVSWGFRDSKSLSAANPDTIVDTPADILNLFS